MESEFISPPNYHQHHNTPHHRSLFGSTVTSRIMHLDSLLQIKKEAPKKGYCYTTIRFEKNKHNDLINKRAAVYDIDGCFLIVPIKEAVITLKNLLGRISEVRASIEGYLTVQTQRETCLIERDRKGECCYGDSNPSRRSESPS